MCDVLRGGAPQASVEPTALRCAPCGGPPQNFDWSYSIPARPARPVEEKLLDESPWSCPVRAVASRKCLKCRDQVCQRLLECAQNDVGRKDPKALNGALSGSAGPAPPAGSGFDPKARSERTGAAVPVAERCCWSSWPAGPAPPGGSGLDLKARNGSSTGAERLCWSCTAGWGPDWI